ncbi:phage portal protein [Flavobacteriaceae bacterium Ap0902]|nr:phage portal protein [Flavobacteriaceae bacterium Ap0902]
MGNWLSKIFNSENTFSDTRGGKSRDWYLGNATKSSWGKTKYSHVEASLKIAAVNRSVSLIGDVFASGKYVAKNAKGEIVENDPLVNLLNNPNDLQSGEELRKQFVRYLLSSGYCFLEPINFENTARPRDLSHKGTQLFALNPDKISFETNYLFGLVKMPLKEGRFKLDCGNYSQTKVFNSIIPFYDLGQDPNNNLKGISRLDSLEIELENIVTANKAKSNQLKLSGSTVVTPGTKNRADSFDMGLDTPVDFDNPDKTEKDAIEEKLHATGLGQGKTITVSGVELKSFNLMEGIKDIDFSEMRKSDEITVFNQFGIPPEFHQLDSSPKYENRAQAGIEIIEFICKPLASNFCNSIREKYEHENDIEIDFSDSPYYAYQNEKKSKERQSTVELYRGLLEDGVINVQEYSQILRDERIIK